MERAGSNPCLILKTSRKADVITVDSQREWQYTHITKNNVG